MLMALGADVDSLAQTIIVESHGGPAGIKIFGEGGKDLAFLGFDNITPEPCGMEMTGRKGAFEGEMVFFALGQLVEFDNLETE